MTCTYPGACRHQYADNDGGFWCRVYRKECHMKLIMDPGEILREYTGAKNKFQQVSILADQNCVKKKDMAAWLRDQGCEVDGRFFSEGRKKFNIEPGPVLNETSEPEEMISIPDPVMDFPPVHLTRAEAEVTAQVIKQSLSDMAKVMQFDTLVNAVTAYKKLTEATDDRSDL